MHTYIVLLATFLLSALPLAPQAQPATPDAPSLRITSNLVVLDVTVLDKNGKPVTGGLGKEDFTIIEEGKSQKIFSFESPQAHVLPPDFNDDDPDGRAPASIFVLDRLNSPIEDFERGRQAMRTYLALQPELLQSPAEIMLLGNNSMEMLQGFTRSKRDLLATVEQVRPAIPYKLAHPDFNGERAQQSISALIEIAVQNIGVPGRKNIFWVGPGGPSLTRAAYGPMLDSWKPFMHSVVDLLVDSRISLFVIFPSLQTSNSSLTLGSPDADDRSSNIGNNTVKTGDVNFALFASQTGGALFYNRNDIDAEIGESWLLGAHYFTLSYQPTDHKLDGKYRRIRVNMRASGLRAITKEGYFAFDKSRPVNPQQQTVINMTHAASSPLPFTALSMRISDIVRQPPTHSAQFVVHIVPKNLGWRPTAEGKKSASLIMAVTSLSANKKILAWKFEKLDLQSSAEDPDQLKDEMRVRLTALLPAKTDMVRVVLETADGGRIGTVDLDQKLVNEAPELPASPSQSSP